MSHIVRFSLTFEGELADRNEIDFYDVAEALIGFQRSLALTTHLILNDQVITQAPYLKGATILALPPEPGSWKIWAGVSLAATAAYHTLTTPKETPLGNLVYSAYDYVISESLGFHVDYSKSLGQQYEELKRTHPDIPKLPQHRFDAVLEKCDTAIKNIHRPIFAGGTAVTADISARVGRGPARPVGGQLNIKTYEHLAYTRTSNDSVILKGRVSSYNSNTFKGRTFVPEYGRPLPFELLEFARNDKALVLITESLTINTLHPKDHNIGYVFFRAFLKYSKTGTVKGLVISAVYRNRPVA